MEKKKKEENIDKTESKTLNEILTFDSHIKRENIIEAEKLLFNNTLKNLPYDEYGFVNNINPKKNNQQYINIFL